MQLITKFTLAILVGYPHVDRGARNVPSLWACERGFSGVCHMVYASGRMVEYTEKEQGASSLLAQASSIGKDLRMIQNILFFFFCLFLVFFFSSSRHELKSSPFIAIHVLLAETETENDLLLSPSLFLRKTARKTKVATLFFG